MERIGGRMRNLRWKLQDFMRGRNGFDELNRALFVGYFAFFLLNVITGVKVFYLLELLVLIYMLYRMFSRKIWDRQQENKTYTDFTHLWKLRWKYRKEYRVFRCNSCNKIVRVPRHKGKVEVTCPQCGTRRICRTGK